jgi:hypothetical protein
MFALHKHFWEKKTLCKKLADLHNGQGILLQKNNFSSLHKEGCRLAEKNMLLLRFLWSQPANPSPGGYETG